MIGQKCGDRIFEYKFPGFINQTNYLGNSVDDYEILQILGEDSFSKIFKLNLKLYESVTDVDFKKDEASIYISSKTDKPSVIEIDGKVPGNIKVFNTDGKYATFHVQFDNIKGRHTPGIEEKLGDLSIDNYNAVDNEKKDKIENILTSLFLKRRII